MHIHISDPVKFLNERKFTVLWSGGKDSTASLLWILDNIKHEDWNVLFIEVTGNTHRLNIEYVYGIARQLGIANKLIHARREDLDFFDALRRWGIPVIGYSRWCLKEFKEKVIERHSYFTQVSGIRRTDSARRKHVGLIEYYRMTGNIAVNVIYDWSKERVLQYTKEHGVEINPCYRIYGHSGNCLLPSTLVLTGNYTTKPISSISVGDRILSYNPLTRMVESAKVTHVFRRPYSGPIVMLKPFHLYEVGLTPEHPVYVMVKRKFNAKPYYRKVWEGWIEAGELYRLWRERKNNYFYYIAFPFPNQVVDVPWIDEKWLKFLGWYVAEGCIREGREVRFSLGRDELPVALELSKIFAEFTGREAKIKDRPNEGELLVKAYSKDVAERVSVLVNGRRAEEKSMSMHLLLLPPSKQRVLLDAIIAGDGYRKGNQIIYTTASPNLAFQVHLLFLRTGMVAGLSSQGGSPFKPGKRYFRINAYISDHHYGNIDGSILWNSIQSIRVVNYSGEVYNLEVEPNNNYITQGGLVHNCMFCPYHKYEYIVKTLRDPEWGPRIIEALEYVARNVRMGKISKQKYEKWMKVAKNLNNNLEKWINHG